MNFSTPHSFSGAPQAVFEMQQIEKPLLQEQSPNIEKLRSAIGNRADLLAKQHMKKARMKSAAVRKS